MTLENASILKSVTSMVGTPQLVKSRLTVSGRPLYLRSDASDAERLKQQIREAHSGERELNRRSWSVLQLALTPSVSVVAMS